MKIKGKFRAKTLHERSEGEQGYSCTLSLTSALDGVGGQRHVPAAFPSGMNRHTLYGGLVGSMTGLEECGKFRLQPDLIPGPSSP